MVEKSNTLLVPVYNVGITLQEIPDKIAAFFNMGSCFSECEGCHSRALWSDIPYHDLWTVDKMLRYADRQMSLGATAICVLGGTTNRQISIEGLISILNRLAMIAPTCLYSGSDDEKLNRHIIDNTDLTWIKTGSYNGKPLTDKDTNQRFYKINHNFTFNTVSGFVCDRKDTIELLDLTHRFRKGE